MTLPAVRRGQPGPGQESVWDYPRPPRVEPTAERIVVVVAGSTILDTSRALRVLETSHPPAYYLPRQDFLDGTLVEADGTSWCEYKGTAHYLDVVVGQQRLFRAAWHYPRPTADFEALVDHVALYPGAMERVAVDGETVRAQEGGFYGGWITNRVVGPFKGAPNTRGW